MQKKRYRPLIIFIQTTGFRQIVRAMKLTAILLACAFIHVYATGNAQSITLSGKNMSLKTFFKSVEKQTGYAVLGKKGVYSHNKRVSVSVNNMPLTQVLDQVMKDQPLGYIIQGKTIVLFEKRPPLPDPGISPTASNDLKPLSEVHGRVVDSTKAPLAGASVRIKDSNIGVYTDANGEFTINAQETDVLIVSFVGYQAIEVPAAGTAASLITLYAVENKLDNLVVVGYGTQKKASVTGAIASISSRQLNTTTNPNVVNMLAGKLPGLRVIQGDAGPGNYNTTFDIRGMGAPLVIIDGIPAATDKALNRLNPNDIESISILKDASAAVYGVRAANGVVLITTRKGKAGKVEINYTGTVGGSVPTIFPHGLNTYQYATLTNEADINQGGQPTFSKEQIRQYKDGTLKGTDWFGLLARKYAPQVQHNLSVDGGTDKINYYFSAGIYEDDGLWKSGSLNDKKYSFRSNITAQITPSIKAQMLLSGIRDKRSMPYGSSSGILNQPLLMPPTMPAYANDNPLYLQDTKVSPSNPVALTNSSIVGYDNNTINALTGSLIIDYDAPFIPGLRVRALYSYNPTITFNKAWRKKYPLYTYDEVTGTYEAAYRQAPSTLYESFNSQITSDAQISLNYEKALEGRHNIKALLLFEKLNSGSDNFNGSKEFTLDAIDQLYAGNNDNNKITSAITSPSANLGLVGRLNYDYEGKYLVEGSFRYDGSSKFAAGNRWGFFPSISLGWRLSEESFIKDNIRAMDNLKLRVSWGRLGDDAASTYQFLTGYNYPSGNYVFDNTVVSGLSSRGMPNPDITWFTATTTDIGLDGDFWNGKLNFTFDVFRRKKMGMLATRILSLPATVGASLPQENLNSNMTQGFELEIGHANHINELQYHISGNVSFARTKNLYVERATSTNPYKNWRENTSDRWNGIVWGYTVVGQFQSQEEIDQWAIEDGKGNTTVLPGDLKYEDYNGDGIIDDNDVKPIARDPNLPEVNFGIALGLSWRGIDFNMLVQGAENFWVNQNSSNLFNTPVPYKRNGLLTEFMDRWHHEDIFDPASPWVPGKYPATRYEGAQNVNHLASTFWWHYDPYIRLKSLELGYTVPEQLTRNIVRNIRVFVNGFNMLTLSKVKYIDPEHGTNTYYPVMKSFNAGLNVTF